MPSKRTLLGGAVLAAAALLLAPPAVADKPAWAGGKHSKEADQHRRAGEGKKRKGHPSANEERHGDDHRRDRGAKSPHFGDRDYLIVRSYYRRALKGDSCPPGLAKKGNGCLAPGQARKWRRGRVLPADVVYHELPAPLVTQLPPAPTGHRYVRVAADILLIAVGTAMVVDAIEDLTR